MLLLDIFSASSRYAVTRCIQCQVMGPRWFNVYSQVHQIIWSGFFMKSNVPAVCDCCPDRGARVHESQMLGRHRSKADHSTKKTWQTRRGVVAHIVSLSELTQDASKYKCALLHHRMQTVKSKHSDNRCECIKNILAFINWDQWCVLIRVEHIIKWCGGHPPIL